MTYVLYPAERKVLETIIQYINRNGFAPTLQEIADVVGVSSPATVHEHIQALVTKGFLVKVGRIKRGYDLAPPLKKREMDNNEPALDLPHFGFIVAGSPIEPNPDPTAGFKVPASMVSKDKPAYVLQVRGDSMRDDGILDGDYVIVEYTEIASDGDIVIAFLQENGLATLKRFYKEDDRIILKPANSEMQPIITRDVRIQGKVVGLVRRFSANLS